MTDLPVTDRKFDAALAAMARFSLVARFDSNVDVALSHLWFVLAASFMTFWCGRLVAPSTLHLAVGTLFALTISAFIAQLGMRHATSGAASFDLYVLSFVVGIAICEFSELQAAFSSTAVGDIATGLLGPWRLAGLIPFVLGMMGVIGVLDGGHRLESGAIAVCGVAIVTLPAVPGFSWHFVVEPVLFVGIMVFGGLWQASALLVRVDHARDSRAMPEYGLRFGIIAFIICLWSIVRLGFFPALPLITGYTWDLVLVDVFGAVPALVLTTLLICAFAAALVTAGGERDGHRNDRYDELDLEADWLVPIVLTCLMWIGWAAAANYLPLGWWLAPVSVVTLTRLISMRVGRTSGGNREGFASCIHDAVVFTLLACAALYTLSRGAYALCAAVFVSVFMVLASARATRFEVSSPVVKGGRSAFTLLLERIIVSFSLLVVALLPSCGFTVMRLAFVVASLVTCVIAMRLTVCNRLDDSLGAVDVRSWGDLARRVRHRGLSSAFARAGMFKIRAAMALGFCLLMLCASRTWDATPAVLKDSLTTEGGIALTDAGRYLYVEVPPSRHVRSISYRTSDLQDLFSPDDVFIFWTSKDGARAVDPAHPVIEMDKEHAVIWVEYDDGSWAVREAWLDLSHRPVWEARAAAEAQQAAIPAGAAPAGQHAPAGQQAPAGQ